MDFPKFPYIEVTKNNTQTVEKPLVENFLQNLISELVAEISLLETSCDKLRNSNTDMQTLKEKYLREIFAITHDKKGEDILCLQLSKRMQDELGTFRLGEQKVSELLERFHKEYKDWRLSLEQQMQNSLGTDDIIFLPQQELTNKLDTLKATAKNVNNELDVIEKIADHKHKLLEGKLRDLQVEVHKLQALRTEVIAAQQKLIDEIKEKQVKYQQDSNILLKEITSLQEKLDIYE